MKVNTEALLQQSDNLRPVLNVLRDVREIVVQSDTVLQRENFGKDFHPALLDSARRLDLLTRDVSHLITGLEMISQRYMECEIRIAEHAEQSGFQYPRKQVVAVAVPDIPLHLSHMESHQE